MEVRKLTEKQESELDREPPPPLRTPVRVQELPGSGAPNVNIVLDNDGDGIVRCPFCREVYYCCRCDRR
jgi:hypothetical protein